MPVGKLIDDGSVRPPQKKNSLAEQLLALLSGNSSTPTPSPSESPSTGTSLSQAYTNYLTQPEPDPNSRAGALQQYYQQQYANSEAGRAAARELQMEEDRDQREQALGYGPAIDMPFLPELEGVERNRERKRPQVKPMTEDEYLALDPQQKAAVDFNTMLVQAVRRDRRLDKRGAYDDVSDAQRETYEASVEEAFGEDGGSTNYAPETMALLSQIGYNDEAGDLDDFLKLRAAITSKDLGYLSDQGAKAQFQSQALQGTPTQDRLEQNSLLASSTARLQETLARGSELLQTMGATAYAARENRVGLFGGSARQNIAGAGFGNDEVSTVFKQAFDALAAKDGEDPNKVLGFFETKDPALLQQFISYADTRTGQAEEYGLSLGDQAGVKYRSPEEFRKLLGLDKRG